MLTGWDLAVRARRTGRRQATDPRHLVHGAASGRHRRLAAATSSGRALRVAARTLMARSLDTRVIIPAYLLGNRAMITRVASVIQPTFSSSHRTRALLVPRTARCGKRQCKNNGTARNWPAARLSSDGILLRPGTTSVNFQKLWDFALAWASRMWATAAVTCSAYLMSSHSSGTCMLESVPMAPVTTKSACG
jgi:hypothetical protein